jgi:TPR repeat protein
VEGSRRVLRGFGEGLKDRIDTLSFGVVMKYKSFIYMLFCATFLSSACWGQDWSEWRQKAERGDAEAQYIMGRIYSAGNGVPQNDDESARWFHLAAEQGYLMAQSRLGYCYAGGVGVDKDLGKAKKWLRLAAERGEADAQMILGAIYAEEGDIAEGYAWLLISSASGNSDAAELRKECLQCMTPSQLKEGVKLSAKYKWNISKSKLFK